MQTYPKHLPRPVVARLLAVARCRARGVATVAASSLAIVIFACSSAEAPVPTMPQVAVRFDEGQQYTAHQQDRARVALSRTTFAGEAHDAAMDVVIGSMVEHRAAKRRFPKAGTREYCAILEEAGDAAVTVLDHHRGLNRGKSGRLAAIRNDPAMAGCARSRLSVLGLPSLKRPNALAPIQYDPEVTGAYEQYLDAMEIAVTGSDGSVRGVTSRVNTVVSQAAADGIPEGDLLALSAFANVAISSTVEWNSFDWSLVGGGGTCDQADGCNVLSVFPMRAAGSDVMKVVAADIGGCLSGVKGWKALKLLLLGPASSALAAECGVRAAIGSGVAIIALM